MTSISGDRCTQQLNGRIALITGASSGIGAACARRFAEAGWKLILTARRLDRLSELAGELSRQYKAESFPLALDVSDRRQVEEKLRNLPSNWQEIDLLINNAGLAHGLELFQNSNLDSVDRMIDTNIKGLLYVTHTLLPNMLKRNAGQIINIGSISGRSVYQKGMVYCATKFAVHAITQGLKLDLLGTKIKVSTVDPGLVESEFSMVRFEGDSARAQLAYKGMTPLTPADVAQSVYFCASQPEHININEIVVMPTDQASVTMVNRRQ